MPGTLPVAQPRGEIFYLFEPYTSQKNPESGSVSHMRKLLVAMRIEPEIAAAADRLIGKPGRPTRTKSGVAWSILRNRSDVLREALRRGLDDMELAMPELF